MKLVGIELYLRHPQRITKVLVFFFSIFSHHAIHVCKSTRGKVSSHLMIISVTQMKPFITKSGNYSTPAPQVSYTTFPRLDSCTHSDWAFDFAEEKKN